MTGNGKGRYRPVLDGVLLFFAVLVFTGLLGLGIWQIQRLSWKLDLIKTLEDRAFGDPVVLPEGKINQKEHAYLRVKVSGIYRHDLSRKVKAVTDLGPGYWLLTPLETSPERYVWINRGFVPARLSPDKWTKPAGPQTIQGLLRLSEPGGTLLEKNHPEHNRWVSRDIHALSQDVGIGDTADYFIDADFDGSSVKWPRAGMTIIKFRNPHLAYALTWFIMAFLLLVGILYALYDRRRDRRAGLLK